MTPKRLKVNNLELEAVGRFQVEFDSSKDVIKLLESSQRMVIEPRSAPINDRLYAHIDARVQGINYVLLPKLLPRIRVQLDASDSLSPAIRKVLTPTVLDGALVHQVHVGESTGVVELEKREALYKSAK